MKKNFAHMALVLAGLAGMAFQGRISTAQVKIDVRAEGIPIRRQLLGLNWDLSDVQGNLKTIKIPPGTLTRGVAGGLYADTFDWEKATGATHHATIDFLRELRDNDSAGLITVNVRGTGIGEHYDDFRYTDTSPAPLVQLATDWVRYVNFIVPNGPQNAGDQAILDRIDWTKGSASPKRPTPDEGALPKIEYWEIGNEPEIAIQDYQFTDDPEELPPLKPGKPIAEFVGRYKTITAAMKAVDPTIKVGPGMLDAVAETVMPLLDDRGATIDFWAYHPYDDLGRYYHPNGSPAQIDKMEARLCNVRANQIKKYNAQRQAFINAGRDPDQVEFMLTEWNAMSWKYDYPSMYQALGFADSIFTFAQLKVSAAQLWSNLAYDQKVNSDPYPMVKLWRTMSEHLGDTLVNSHIDDANRLRIYTTRDSKTGEVVVWGLNFDNDSVKNIDLSLQGINASVSATLSILSDGPQTRLWSAGANWSARNLPDFNPQNIHLQIPGASIIMLRIHTPAGS